MLKKKFLSLSLSLSLSLESRGVTVFPAKLCIDRKWLSLCVSYLDLEDVFVWFERFARDWAHVSVDLAVLVKQLAVEGVPRGGYHHRVFCQFTA